jgi:hypothetical protein
LFVDEVDVVDVVVVVVEVVDVGACDDDETMNESK